MSGKLEQLELLFIDVSEPKPKPEPMPDGLPTWDDVQKKRAHVVYRYEACDKCAGEPVSYWDANKRECMHVKGRYAYPKRITRGGWHGWLCRKTYLDWGEGCACVEIDGMELNICGCGGFPDFVGCGSKHYVDEWHQDYSTWMVQCKQCLNSAYAKGQSKLEAAQRWNAGQYLEYKKWGET